MPVKITEFAMYPKGDHTICASVLQVLTLAILFSSRLYIHIFHCYFFLLFFYTTIYHISMLSNTIINVLSKHEKVPYYSLYLILIRQSIIYSLKYYQNILWRNSQLYTCIFEMLRASQKTEIALQLCITVVVTFIPIIKVANTYWLFHMNTYWVFPYVHFLFLPWPKLWIFRLLWQEVWEVE